MTVRSSQTYDNLLLLKDAGAVTASGAATVAAQARVLDLGLGRFEARAIIDASAVDTADANETYRVAIQGSNDPAFGSGVVELGATTVTGAGRSEARFTSQPNDVIYRYVRAFLTLTGTTPSINSVIYLVKN